MKRRVLKHRASRARQLTRATLVHAAGCTHEHCFTKWYVYPDIVETADLSGVRIPRSLRGVIGKGK